MENRDKSNRSYTYEMAEGIASGNFTTGNKMKKRRQLLQAENMAT
jgi:hypothetical protein